jgi:hypothetical protein
VPHVVRTRDCSGTDTPYVVHDLLVKRGVGRLCRSCTPEKQRPIYHLKDILTGEKTTCPYGLGQRKGGYKRTSGATQDEYSSAASVRLPVSRN